MAKGVPKGVAEAMNKAGFPPWMTLFVAFLSIPGVWEFFVNDQEEVAEAKAEVGYEIAKQSIEALRRENADIKRQIQRNQEMLFQLAMKSSGGFVKEDTVEESAGEGAVANEESASKQVEKGNRLKRSSGLLGIVGDSGGGFVFDSSSVDDLAGIDNVSGVGAVEACEDEELGAKKREGPVAPEPLPSISAPGAPKPHVQQQKMPDDLDGPVKKWLKKKAAAE